MYQENIPIEMNQWFITVHSNGFKSDSAVMVLQTAIVGRLILGI